MKHILSKDKENKKRNGWPRAIIIGVFIALLSVAGWSLREIWQEYNLPAEEIVIKAIDNTLEHESYSFQAKAFRQNNDNEEKICSVNGEVNGENAHLYGSIDLVESEFEIYQIGENFYRRDSVDGRWLVIDNLGRETMENLVTEINPLNLLRFASPFEVEYLGKEVINDKKYRKFEILNYMTDEYLTYDWQNILLRIWVDKKGYIYRAEVVANEKDEPQKRLTLQVDFQLNDEVELIKAPI